MDEKDNELRRINRQSNQTGLEDFEAQENDLYQEETASEFVDERDMLDSRSEDADDTELKSAYGWVSIALSVISFFFLPFILAVAGIVVGFIVRFREAPILGNIEFVIVVLLFVVTLFILLFIYYRCLIISYFLFV